MFVGFYAYQSTKKHANIYASRYGVSKEHLAVNFLIHINMYYFQKINVPSEEREGD